MDKGQAEIQDRIEGIPESSQGDRRSHPRLRVLSLAYVTVGENNGGIVVDVSEDGLQVVAAEALMISGEDFRLCIRPSNPPDPIVVAGHIIWISSSRKSAGFCFVSPSAHVRQQIRRWIAQELRGSAAPERPATVATPAPIAGQERTVRVPARPAVTEESDVRETDVMANFPSITDLHATPALQPEVKNVAIQSAVANNEAPAQPAPPSSEKFAEAVADVLKREERRVEPAIEAPPAGPEPPRQVTTSRVAYKSYGGNEKVFPAAGTPTTLPLNGSNGWLPKGETLFASAPEPIKASAAQVPSDSEGWWTPLNLGILCAVIMILCLTAGMLAGRFMSGNEIWNKITGTASAPRAQSANPTVTAPQSTAPAQSVAPRSPNAAVQQPATAPNTAAATPDTSAPVPNAPAVTSPRNSARNPASQVPAGSANDDTTSMTSDTTALVMSPPEDREPALVTFPQEAVTASNSIAIGMTRSVLIAPEPGTVSQHHPKRLVLGKVYAPVPPDELISDVARIASQGARVRLRVTIGTDGNIESMAAIDGPRTLVATAENIVRNWRQEPTRLDGKPVESFEDIAVSFRARQ